MNKNLPAAPSVKMPVELKSMREAGRTVALAMRDALAAVEPGITTQELDDIARAKIEALGAVPAFLGLYGFPATACISLNEEIVHGIPGDRKLEDGDLVSVDCGAIVDGMYSDMARTVVVNESDGAKGQLAQATEQSLRAGLQAIKAGGRVRDIGTMVQQTANSFGYDVVREYVGHGIGKNLHEPPQIPNFVETGKGTDMLLVGMTIAVEPMLVEGDWRTHVLEDNWTVVTKDGRMSAHFEDTVAITPDGYEILTRI